MYIKAIIVMAGKIFMDSRIVQHVTPPQSVKGFHCLKSWPEIRNVMPCMIVFFYLHWSGLHNVIMEGTSIPYTHCQTFAGHSKST